MTLYHLAAMGRLLTGMNPHPYPHSPSLSKPQPLIFILPSLQHQELLLTLRGLDPLAEYCNGPLKIEFGLDTTSEPKPVVGTDDLVRLLTYHWNIDASTYPTEDDRLDRATLMLFQSYTGCRPAELVHAYKTKGRYNPLADSEQDDFNDGANETGDTSDSVVELDEFKELERKYKALCYEDICL